MNITVSPAPSRTPSPQPPKNTYAVNPPARPKCASSAVKLKAYDEYVAGGYRLLSFHCVGCGYDHAYAVAAESGLKHKDHPIWTWNGSMEYPTFKPSLLCSQSDPKSRCHLFVTNGRIEYQSDCWHDFKGQKVDMPDWGAE